VTRGDKYTKLVEWSDRDNCFIGSCPELFYGGCHGVDPVAVFTELRSLVDETIGLYEEEGKPLPMPMSGIDFVNAMQRIA
jgi:predicted RNase H-like HicB family nuclease